MTPVFVQRRPVFRVCSLLAVLTILLLAGCAALSGPPRPDPRSSGIQRLEITSVESPAFEGRAFGRTGQYEKVRGKAHAELDPDDPRNAVITDLRLAPRNARNRVE